MSDVSVDVLGEIVVLGSLGAAIATAALPSASTVQVITVLRGETALIMVLGT
jgi:hypothetical protein